MKYYAIAELDVTDRGWVKAYIENVTPMIARFGGRYLSRTNRIEKLEGERKVPQVIVLVEWPSKEAAETFYHSEEYRPYLESRKAGAINHFVLLPGEDINKAAPIGE